MKNNLLVEKYAEAAQRPYPVYARDHRATVYYINERRVKYNAKPVGTNAQFFLKDLVEVEGYSLTRVAQLCDIPFSTLYRVIEGGIEMPSQITFSRLLRFYCAVKYVDKLRK